MTQADLSELLLGLEHGPLEERKAFAIALGGTGDPRAVGPLYRAFRDGPIREAAAHALLMLGRPAVPWLCEALRDPDRAVRCRAVELLGRIGDPRALAPLCASLEEEGRELRLRAIEALERLRDSRAVPPLIALLEHPGAETAKRAALALGRIGDARAIPPLGAALPRGQLAPALALARIFRRHPEMEVTVELMTALPRLQRALFYISTSALSGAARRHAGAPLRRAIERIEAAIAERQNLPIPAAAPLPSSDSLPVPAAPPPRSSEGLPVPAPSADMEPTPVSCPDG